MGFGDDFKFYGYQSDDTNTYLVKLAAGTASQGGFDEITDPLSVGQYPYGPKNMRHVWAVSSGGKLVRVPIAAPDDTKFISGGTVSLHSTTYTIQGAIGEQRKLSNLGG